MKIMLQLTGDIDAAKLHAFTTKMEGKTDNLQELIYGLALVGIDPKEFTIVVVSIAEEEW